MHSVEPLKIKELENYISDSASEKVQDGLFHYPVSASALSLGDFPLKLRVSIIDTWNFTIEAVPQILGP